MYCVVMYNNMYGNVSPNSAEECHRLSHSTPATENEGIAKETDGAFSSTAPILLLQLRTNACKLHVIQRSGSDRGHTDHAGACEPASNDNEFIPQLQEDT